MKKLRLFTIINLLLASICTYACYDPVPQSVDNMIYRLVEDVSPYYKYWDGHWRQYPADKSTEADNLKLWREQTQTGISNEQLRWFVYKSTMSELNAQKGKAVSIFGEDGYRLLYIAKQCEAFRDYINDPWYYPYKDDAQVANIEKCLGETESYRGRYATRYALQTVRILVSLMKYQEAISYWERYARSLPNDVVKEMAERHVARAYLHAGDAVTAANIYARQGDLKSLVNCGLETDQVWGIVYDQCPDSPFFVTELQFLLTHFDNQFFEKYHHSDFASSPDYEQRDVHTVLTIADKAIKEGRVKDVAMWYYAKAAMQNIIGEPKQALAAVKQGEKHCNDGTFLATSMRVLRIMIEAETCTYNSAYQARLLQDLKWLDYNGRKNLTATIRKSYRREHARDWDGNLLDDYYDVTYPNHYYWNDVMNRILVDVLATRLEREGHTTDALLYANLGVFWIMKNAYGKADCPNEYGLFSTTNLSNAMANMADSCSARQLEQMYEHIAHPTRGIDSLVVKYGRSDVSYWSDMIGTHLIREQRYAQATTWLARVSRQYQRSISTWPYYDRDPFCFKIGWGDQKRRHLKDLDDYKLKFARQMASLKLEMSKGKTPQQRGLAMIRYGVGLRNQQEWCWALSRYSDTVSNYYATEEDPHQYGIFVDISEGKRWIDKGLATLDDKELKAYYLHMFARNKEVMDSCPNTQVADFLRANCDRWSDYAKK